jgi:hypothetical protein
MDFEVIYSAALEKQGLAPSLSGYMGRSTLYVSETRAPKETAPMLPKERDEALYQQRYMRSAKGKAARAKANIDWRARVKAQRERDGVRHARNNALRRATQQALFS